MLVTAAMHPKTSSKTVLACIFALARCSSAACKECPANQEISCESLRSSPGYTYRVPPGTLSSENCEQGWYYQNGTFIVDSTPNADGKGLAVVVAVTPQNLTLSVCENLQWQLDCGKCSCVINYTTARDPLPRNNTTWNEKDGNDLPAWGIAIIVIMVVGAVSAFIFFIGKRACEKTKPVL